MPTISCLHVIKSAMIYPATTFGPNTFFPLRISGILTQRNKDRVMVPTQSVGHANRTRKFRNELP